MNFNTDCFSQVNVEWFRTYGAGYGKNFVNDFAMDSSGNSYITGYVSLNSNNVISGLGTVKYDPNGALLWSKIYEGSSHNYAEAKALAVDMNENVYVTGVCTDNDSSENYCTIKYNSSGEIIWVKKYHGGVGCKDEAVDIILDQNNNVYVTGYTFTNNFSQYFWSTIKYDSAGNQIWITRYDGDILKDKFSRKIILDNENNLYVTGSSSEFSPSGDFCTIKYDQFGNQQWVSFFNNSNLRDNPTDISLDNLGNVYVLGQSYNAVGFFTSIVKYNTDGGELWNATTDSIGNNDGWYFNKISFRLDSENNIYIATTINDYCNTIKYNSNGELQWISKFNVNPDYAYTKGVGVNIDSTGDIYTTGFARVFGNVEPFITIKYTSAGVMLWNRSFHVYNEAEFDEGAFVAVDKNNNVYIAGNHDDPIHSRKALFGLLKYSQSVGITNISSEIPDNYKLYQNYPNPFNPKTIITYEIPENSLITLKVYDIQGKELVTLVNEFQNAGKYEAEFNGNYLSSGVYLYKLSSENFSKTNRMVLLK